MTGNLKYYKENEETPNYAKVIFHFKNKHCLSFVDRRKFGSVGLVAAEAPVFVLPVKKTPTISLKLDFYRLSRTIAVFLKNQA
jgi:formamidopyrimidine-DNA glycosylase